MARKSSHGDRSKGLASMTDIAEYIRNYSAATKRHGEPYLEMIEIWFDNETKLWTIQPKDQYGQQLGEVEHSHHKRDAVSTVIDRIRNTTVRMVVGTRASN